MSTPRATGWILGTVVLVLAIFAGTWFFVAADRFDEASETRAEALSTADRNDLLKVQITRLKADFANLESYKAEIAAMQLQIPQAAQLSDYTRTLSALAESNTVTIAEVSPGVALGVVPPIVVQPVPEAEPVAEGGEAPDASADPAVDAPEPPAAEAPPALEGFVAIPMSFKLVGTYANTAAFLQQVQTGTERLFLVTQLDGTRQVAAEATGGLPEIADGDVQLLITGYLYVLDLTGASPSQDVTTEEDPVVQAPLPTSDRNPFAGLPGAVTTDRD